MHLPQTLRPTLDHALQREEGKKITGFLGISIKATRWRPKDQMLILVLAPRFVLQ